MTEWDYLKKHTSPEEWEVYEQYKDVIEQIAKIFEKQGHSGFTAHWFAPRIAQLVENRLLDKPFVPIHKGEEEWEEIRIGLYQSKRCSGLFKSQKHPPHYLNAIVWVEPSGDTFLGMVQGITSYQYIKYPFYPKHFFVKIYENPETGDYIIIDKQVLKEALEYYKPYTKEAEEFLRKMQNDRNGGR